MLGEEKKSMDLVNRALAVAPDDVWVIYTTGYTYEQLGDREKALEWIGKALEAGYPRKEIERDPWLQDLRSDERFKELLERGQKTH